MKKYEILEHKADLKIRVFGKTKEELFQNTLFAMSECMKPEIKKSAKKARRKIKISSLDLPSLLIDFLSEALYLSQTKKEAYFKANFKKFSTTELTTELITELEAELIGKKVERFGEDIKAATHHNLEVNQKKDGSWQAIVLFDI